MIAKEQQIEILPVTTKIELTTNGYIGHFKQYILTSAFQPIFSFAHESPIGYEALLRATNSKDQKIAPADLFSSIYLQDELLELEKISRTIHILNFFRENTNNALLFLNINPRLINNGYQCLKQLLEFLNEYNIPPTRIVIEFTEELFISSDTLIKASMYLHQCGCLIAIDDFGAGHSNFNRVWDLRPDIVKLDKSLVQRAKQSTWFHNSIANLVELLHESESIVLIEGIEDETDAELAHKLNVDFHQGYFFGYPQPLPFLNDIENHYLKNHTQNYPENTNRRDYAVLTQHLKFLFNQAATSTQATLNLNDSCEGLLTHPSVILCYLLNEKGYQIGSDVYGKHSTQNLNHIYGKVSDTNGINWSRRNYFQQALSKPMSIQNTRPYLSLASGKLCITLSISINISNKTHVLCCDLMCNNS